MPAPMLEYTFFQNALAGILIISVASAIIGTYIITRRLVAIAGGITHACFGGLGLGYFMGVSPVAMAALFAVASSLGVEWLGHRSRLRSDSAIAVVWALGMALGVLLVFLTPGYVPELNSFLFGNILTITRTDIGAFAIYTLMLLAFCLMLWPKITICAFDPDFARVQGLPVRFITTAMTVFVAVGIVLTIRLVGVMLLMAMLTLPQLIAETFTRRMLPMVVGAVAASLLTSLAGLWLAVYIDAPCSALIVLVQVAAFAIVRFFVFLCEITRGNARV